MDKDLKSYTKEQLLELVLQSGGKKFHCDYIYDFIHKKDVEQISDITAVSKALREKLVSDGFSISKLNLIESFEDNDGTVKFVFETFDGCRIETVLMDDDGRLTLCISSQIGCKMGCGFCATAKIGFRRNLTAGEIVDQVYQAEKKTGKISNIVYMGMGEPFDNYENTIASMEILNSPKGRNIGARHITVSTCGIPEKILDFAKLGQQFRLAVSLHSAFENVRTKLMPCNAKYPIADIITSLKGYLRITGRRITFEYCMLDSVNDSPEDAAAICRLIKPLKCNINLIEYNPHPKSKYKASSGQKIRAFQKILIEKGIDAQLRLKRGANIKAACGQLGLLGG